MSLRVLLGTYANAGGAGLRMLTFQDGTWTAGDTFPDARNASFGTRSQRHDLYYFVDEQADGAVGVYRASDGGWQTIATVPARGAEPCYVALDPKEELLAVANYGSGSAAVFRIDPHPACPPTRRSCWRIPGTAGTAIARRGRTSIAHVFHRTGGGSMSSISARTR